MKISKIFRRDNSKSGKTAVLIPKKGDRWKNVNACAGRFKGKLERKQPRTFNDRRWLR